MELNNGLLTLFVIASLLIGGLTGGLISGGTDVTEVDKIVYQDRLIEKDCPACECPEFVMPEIENADNALLNEFLESEFAEEYDCIKGKAKFFALEELEDHEDRVVVEYLMSLIEGVDEDSIRVEVEDTEVQVTKLGLTEGEAAARVTFEIEVKYEFEEGIVEDVYQKDIVVVYGVVFDEVEFEDEVGFVCDLDDEEVELVSIA